MDKDYLKVTCSPAVQATPEVHAATPVQLPLLVGDAVEEVVVEDTVLEDFEDIELVENIDVELEEGDDAAPAHALTTFSYWLEYIP